MDPFYRARFTFDITEEQRLRANNLIATHTRKAIFQPILDDLLDLIEKHGDIISGIIMSGKAKPREIIPILNQAEKKAERSVR
jgi:hypothetical protein